MDLDGSRVGDISFSPSLPTWIISLYVTFSAFFSHPAICVERHARQFQKRRRRNFFLFFFFFTGGTLGCNVSSFINVTAGCELITSLTVWLHSPSDEAK